MIRNIINPSVYCNQLLKSLDTIRYEPTNKNSTPPSIGLYFVDLVLTL